MLPIGLGLYCVPVQKMLATIPYCFPLGYIVAARACRARSMPSLRLRSSIRAMGAAAARAVTPRERVIAAIAPCHCGDPARLIHTPLQYPILAFSPRLYIIVCGRLGLWRDHR
jgi:hypothetical protein